MAVQAVYGNEAGTKLEVQNEQDGFTRIFAMNEFR